MIININLSTESVENAIEQIKKYKEELKVKEQQFVERLLEEGYQLVTAKIVELDAVRTGDLLGSINITQDGLYTGYIRADTDYAMYVEFGTGVVGEGSPHITVDGIEWKYDINEHGEAGWWYWDDNDCNYHWTKGMKSRPYMYDSAQELKTRVVDIAREVFKT